jgi:predicted nucleic acid-binding Zn ribbon protein
MISKVEYKEDGSIDLDTSGEEELKKRADISKHSLDTKTGEFKLDPFSGHREGLGGMEKGGEEQKFRNDLKRTGWKEAKKATDVKHKCPVCGTIYWGRPNKAYCGTPCKEVAKKRRSRKKKRDIRDFKPHRGKAGEVYFMYEDKGTTKITFIPAFNADTRERAKQYIEKMCPEDKRDDYIQQVNEVIRE